MTCSLPAAACCCCLLLLLLPMCLQLAEGAVQCWQGIIRLQCL